MRVGSALPPSIPPPPNVLTQGHELCVHFVLLAYMARYITFMLYIRAPKILEHVIINFSGLDST